MKLSKNEQGTIRQVIRGERPWTDLRATGINVQLEGNRLRIENPHDAHAPADIYDLAQGLLAHLPDTHRLRTWAFLLEAESFVDWVDGEHYPAWEPLWNAVWSASFGDPVSEEAIRTAEHLVQEKKTDR